MFLRVLAALGIGSLKRASPWQEAAGLSEMRSDRQTGRPAGRPVLRGQSDGLRDRAVGFDDSGRNMLIPRGIVGIHNMDLL